MKKNDTSNNGDSRSWADVVAPRTVSAPVASSSLRPSRDESYTGPSSRQRFQLAQTIAADIGLNGHVLVEIASEEGGQVSLDLTLIGSQGAFRELQPRRFILEFCSKASLASDLIEIPDKIKAAFEDVIPNIADLGAEKGRSYPNPPHVSSYVESNEELAKELEEMGAVHREAYESGLMKQRVDLVVDYISSMLAYYNFVVDITHKRGGVNQKKEHSAIVALDAISHFLSLDNPEMPLEKKEFYQQALGRHGEFADGMIRIFGKKAANVRKDFNGDENSFCEAFNEIANNPKLVGSVIEGLLDFAKTNDRDEGNLMTMSKRVLEMSLITFPELQRLDKTLIAEGFLESIAENQKWQISREEIKQFSMQVCGINNRAASALSMTN